jgi:serine/threonine protein kinase
MDSTSSEGERPTRDDGAEALFLDYLARLEDDTAETDFDHYCTEHPGHEESLRALMANHVLAPGAGSRTVSDSPALSDSVDAAPSFAGESSRYSMKHHLADGGQGVIHRVWDGQLLRTIAMKTLHSGAKSGAKLPATEPDPTKLAQFLEEARITAQLDHPGIVPVHEMGVDSRGENYFTMRLVKGEDFTDIIERVHAQDPDWPLTRAVGVLFKVCETIAFAHDKGVLHRDLKPSNIRVGRYGEAYVMDWGLAKAQGSPDLRDRPSRKSTADPVSTIRTPRKDERVRGSDSPYLTTDGGIKGTLVYMPPEQAEGRMSEVDERADVYSIGAVLYQLLTGQRPYQEESDELSIISILATVRKFPPRPIRELAPDSPEALVDICSKAMERDPRLRYASAQELGDDVRAYLEGRIESKSASIFEVLRLSMSLALLYVGVLIVVLGPAIQLTSTWESTGFLGRFLLISTPALALGLVGRAFWRSGQFKIGLPLLLGCALVVPSLTFVLAHEIGSLSHAAVEQRGETIEVEALLTDFDPFGSDSAIQAAIDTKLLLAVIALLIAGIVLQRQTRSSAFLWLSSIASLIAYALAANHTGWRSFDTHIRATMFLPIAVTMLISGFVLEYRGNLQAGRPLYVTGYLVFAIAWFYLATEGYPAELLGIENESQVSLMFGGLVSLAIGYCVQRIGTPLLSRYSTTPYLVAPAAILLSMSILVDKEILLYEFLLPATCLAFVGLSVFLQRKTLLYSGAGYLSFALFQITHNHFEEEWIWPLILMIIGAVLAAGAVMSGKFAERAQLSSDSSQE